VSERVILATAPLRGPGLDLLRTLGEVVLDPWIDHQPLRLYNADQLAERATDLGASVVICEADSCKGPVLELPLEAIGSTRGDPTNVDVAGATDKGIPVLRAPGRNADAVAELAVGLLLACTRGLLAADHDVRTGQVYRDGSIPYQRFRAWQLQGQTVGVVGYGAVGRAAAWRYQGLGMRVISADPFAPDATHELDDLLAEADVVSMHAAVTPDTLGLMSEARFARMREGSV
jgi:D-3-phosphoglycerate dehydrogenase